MGVGVDLSDARTGYREFGEVGEVGEHVARNVWDHPCKGSGVERVLLPCVMGKFLPDFPHFPIQCVTF